MVGCLKILFMSTVSKNGSDDWDVFVKLRLKAENLENF